MSKITKEKDRIYIVPKEDIVGDKVENFREEMKSILEGGDLNVVVDFSNIDVIDSSGIGVLISAQNFLKKKLGMVHIINLNPEIYSLFRIMRLDTHFSID